MFGSRKSPSRTAPSLSPKNLNDADSDTRHPRVNGDLRLRVRYWTRARRRLHTTRVVGTGHGPRTGGAPPELWTRRQKLAASKPFRREGSVRPRRLRG